MILRQYKYHSIPDVVSMSNCKNGLLVRRGPYWHYGGQDADKDGNPTFGEIVSFTQTALEQSQYWATVKWDNGYSDKYRVGPYYYDLIVADENYKSIMDLV